MAVRVSSAAFGGGMYVSGGSASFEDCRIDDCVATQDGGGIYLKDAASVRILRCTNYLNDASSSGMGGGVYAENIAQLSIRDSTVTNNEAVHGGGIALKGTGAEIVNAAFYSDYSPGGDSDSVLCVNASCAFVNSIISSPRVGVAVDASSTSTFDHCDLYSSRRPSISGVVYPIGQAGNIAVDPAYAGSYHLSNASPCRDAGNDAAVAADETDGDGRSRIVGAHVDMGAYEYTTEPARLVFTVAPGSGLVGHPLDPQPVVTITNPSGETSTTYNAPVSLTLIPSDAAFSGMLQGTTIVNAVNGVATFTNVSVSGTGIYFQLTASSGSLPPVNGGNLNVGLPRIYVTPGGDDANDGASWDRAKASVNAAAMASGPGGEVWVSAGRYVTGEADSNGVSLFGGFTGVETARTQRNPRANLTILVANGSGTGLHLSSSSQPMYVDGFTLRGSSSTGVFIYNGGTAPVVVSHNVIEGSGSGSSPYSEGVYSSAGAPVVMDNLITGNFGTAIQLSFAQKARIIGNTIAGNKTGIAETGGALITNNVVAFNTGAGIANTSSSLSHNVLFGNASNASGTTGIFLDPLFQDRANGDFHLSTNSPAVDAGDDGAVTAGDTDLDGLPRIGGAHVDVGAYEYAAPFSLADATRALRIACGLTAASAADNQLDVSPPAGVDLADALRLAQTAAGPRTSF